MSHAAFCGDFNRKWFFFRIVERFGKPIASKFFHFLNSVRRTWKKYSYAQNWKTSSRYTTIRNNSLFTLARFLNGENTALEFHNLSSTR